MRRIDVHEIESARGPAALALTLLRVAVGAILVVHGWQKLTDIPGTTAGFAELGIPRPELAVYLAILGEFFGGLGLALGALTPLSAFGVVLAMSSAIYFAHRSNGLLAKQGGWEYPLTLLLVGFYFVARGAGPLSVDALVTRARHRHARHRHDREATSYP